MIKTLHQTLIEELGKREIERTAIPDSIARNLNPTFPMRPYQERAFKLFIKYCRDVGLFICISISW